MEQTIVYQANAKDLREAIIEPIRREVIAEHRAKLNSRLIDVDTLAKIHDVSPDTVYNYIKSGDITCEPRFPNGKCLFKLGDALDIDFRQLRRKLKSK
ncbi:MAG: hypothetical protein JZU65_19500 [Chlorobium sp.]|jgi:hypothetical protein|nr:hypothetical protein [Chlorobium sp.]